MYLALASMSTRLLGDNFDKMVNYVDRKNEDGRHFKYFLIELNDKDYAIYSRGKNLQYCHPTIVYDPYNVGESYLKSVVMYSNGFARTFGSRKGDH